MKIIKYYTVWKFTNFSPTIFCKNSVKLTVSLKSYAVNQFDEKFLQWGKISEITATVAHGAPKASENSST